MLTTNKDRLVQIAVSGPVAHSMASSPYRIKTDGTPITLPGTGGITYNVKVGDPACGWVADHVEPGVSLRHKDEKENAGLNTWPAGTPRWSARPKTRASSPASTAASSMS